MKMNSMERIPTKYTFEEIKQRLKKPETINEKTVKAFVISNYRDAQELRKERIEMMAKIRLSPEYKRLDEIKGELANNKNQYHKIMRLFILPQNLINGK